MRVDLVDVVTLQEASLRLGRSRSFFRVMQHRNPGSFPEPVGKIAGAWVYSYSELVRWDAARGL